MSNLESLVAIIAIVLLFYTLIGSLLTAFLQKLGFRFIVGLSKEEAPGFFKLYLIQILTTLVIAGLVYLFFTTGLFLSPVFAKIYFTAFGISPVGILASLSAQYLLDIAIYVSIAALLTKALAKKSFVSSIQSQIITIILLILIWVTSLALAGSVIFEKLNTFNLIPSEQASSVELPSAPAKSEKSHYGKALDEYEKMISSFEAAAKSEHLCQSDMMNMTLQMIPQLGAMSEEFEKMKGGGNDIDQADVARYLSLINRFNKATIEMNTKTPDPTC